jgi:hypothetical protein
MPMPPKAAWHVLWAAGLLNYFVMRFIPTKVHGLLDYLVGALLAVSPWLLNFNRGGAETWVPVLLGIGAILYSLFTNYEWGVARRISMPTHLTLDLLSGIFLAASPWIFGFADYVYLPHLILGIFEIGASLMTKRQPEGIKSLQGHQATAV